MPALALLIANVVVGIAQFFASYVGKRIALALAVIGVLVAAGLAVTATFRGIIDGLGSLSPGFATVAWSLFPCNVPDLLSLGVTARVALWVYRWQADTIQMKLGV